MHLNVLAQSIAAKNSKALVVLYQGEVEALLREIRLAFNHIISQSTPLLILGEESASLAQLTRSLAAELGPYGIRANAISIAAAADSEAILHTAEFLISDEASYVTGVMLPVGAD
jgi:hypothetical protein